MSKGKQNFYNSVFDMQVDLEDLMMAA